MSVKSAKKGAKRQAATTKTSKILVESSSRNDDQIVTKDEIKRAKANLVEEHLPPLSLIFIVLMCSGALLVLNLRDFLTTGKNVGSSWDEAMMSFTKSTQWFEDAKGWKATQGGFSAVVHVTTDENNMGGFFIRKLCGAAGVAVHLQKLMPLLIHTSGAKWAYGHFRPLLWTAIVANLCVAAFYGFYFDDLKAAGVHELSVVILALLGTESIAMIFYLFTSSRVKRAPAIALPRDKVPSSSPSNIVRNTSLVVTTFFAIGAFRDLFFPGFIIDMIPRDDIYLEWTNAFLHSPPDDTPESEDQGLEAPLYIGDKFISQLMALHILINCLYKYVSSVGISFGNDGSGVLKATMFWKAQAIGCGLVCFVYRVFTPAANSASFDMRWHLMLLGYEGFIFFVYGFM